jgi:hypothetical protein
VNPTPTSTTAATSFIDVEQLPDGVPFSYRSRAEVRRSESARLQSVLEAGDDHSGEQCTGRHRRFLYDAEGEGAQGRDAGGRVLGNDSDVDSPASFMRAVLVSGPSNGTLILNANGSFTYDPRKRFHRLDTFRIQGQQRILECRPHGSDEHR